MMLATIHDPESPALQRRLMALWERTNDEALRRLAQQKPPTEGCSMATLRERSDWVSTCLMDTFKRTGDPEVFALLFELNAGEFLQAIRAFLRHRICVDANDVLQEAFLNIYRYPHRFLAERSDAFRNWGHRIVRNTMLGCLKGASSHMLPLDGEDERAQHEDTRTPPPERVVSEHESADVVNHAYVLFLGLYLVHFGRLSAKEQLALTMVEIERRSYRDAAIGLGLSVPNLRMVIYRARQRMRRDLNESLAQLHRMEFAAPGALATSDPA